MAKPTTSLVKNTIARCLSEIISPAPTASEEKEIWTYFERKCCYCGQELKDGEGDLDHLITNNDYYINDKYNRVLSCKTCNSKQKLDKDWKLFLKQKCGGDEKLFNERKSKIDNWIKNKKQYLSKEQIDKYLEVKEKINEVFDNGYKELKEFIKKQ